jgi:hypothetical protein
MNSAYMTAHSDGSQVLIEDTSLPRLGIIYLYFNTTVSFIILAFAVCEDPKVLARVLAREPAVFHLKEAGAGLLSRFLSHPSGFTFLEKSGYISRTLQEWHTTKNVSYALDMDAGIFNVISGKTAKRMLINVFRVPIHFYSSLCALQQGVDYLAVSIAQGHRNYHIKL